MTTKKSRKKQTKKRKKTSKSRASKRSSTRASTRSSSGMGAAVPGMCEPVPDINWTKDRITGVARSVPGMKQTGR